MRSAGHSTKIRNVWAHNLEEEMLKIGLLLDRYPIVSLDTEFPGVVSRPLGVFKTPSEYLYQTLRCNVDLLRLIQLGISVADEAGNTPDTACWQFNFKFSLSDDMYSPDAIDFLAQAGIDFAEHEKSGIEIPAFGELVISSGLVLNDEITWVSFHSAYDFGYMMKVVTCDVLPAEHSEFSELLRIFFPRLWDIKMLVSRSDSLHGGLNRLAEELEIARVGQTHQAGSDSLLTSNLFFQLQKRVFRGKLDNSLMGVLYGFHSTPTA
mmetsp:Transcript_13583/g.27806  ORF Transcript_13583/g.27806 Transcript_13583/m.27806 type:complete len:265 (-) Transcript_13583:4559-5353(-)